VQRAELRPQGLVVVDLLEAVTGEDEQVDGVLRRQRLHDRVVAHRESVDARRPRWLVEYEEQAARRRRARSGRDAAAFHADALSLWCRALRREAGGATSA
jgi:hypothetical protein